MKRRIRPLLLVICFCIVCILVFGYTIGAGLFLKTSDVESFRTFIVHNRAVQDYFGELKSVALVHSTGYRLVKISTIDGKTALGIYQFRVTGSRQKGFVQAHWHQQQESVKKITRLSVREGLTAIRILWPISEATAQTYFLPASVWDGMISLVLSALCFLFYDAFHQNREWLNYVYSLKWGKGTRPYMKWVFLILLFGGISKSILCFLNITRLF